MKTWCWGPDEKRDSKHVLSAAAGAKRDDFSAAKVTALTDVKQGRVPQDNQALTQLLQEFRAGVYQAKVEAGYEGDTEGMLSVLWHWS